MAPLDDFKVVLGIEFLEPTKAAPMLAVRSPFMQTKVCARKKLKQEPDRSTNQISEKKSISTGLKAPSRKERSKCGFQACLPVALSLETGGRGSLLAKVRTSAGK